MLPVHYKVKLNQFAINQCWVYLLHNNSFFSKNMDFEMFEIQHITEQLDKLLPDKKKSSIIQLLLPPKKNFSSWQFNSTHIFQLISAPPLLPRAKKDGVPIPEEYDAIFTEDLHREIIITRFNFSTVFHRLLNYYALEKIRPTLEFVPEFCILLAPTLLFWTLYDCIFMFLCCVCAISKEKRLSPSYNSRTSFFYYFVLLL